MSTYVISDIHGEYDKFISLLETIIFSKDDTLFLLGDVIDRGENGLKILQYAMCQPNIFGVIGNHEYMAIQCLKWLHSEITEESVSELSEDLLQGYIEWLNVGGQSTLDEFSTLTREEQENTLDYLNEFSIYEELEINGRSFVLVHAGIDNFESTKGMQEYQLHELIFNKPDYNSEYYPDKYLVTGHTPTRYIYESKLNSSSGIVDNSDNKYDKIFKKNNHIAIDCSCSYGGKLGAICLDTLEEFYV